MDDVLESPESHAAAGAQAHERRPAFWQLMAYGLLGSAVADVVGGAFYVLFGALVVYEMEWLMGVWIFLVGLFILGVIIGPLFGLLAGYFSFRRGGGIKKARSGAFYGGALPILLIWLVLFVLIWVESAKF